jgi:hypothetical protein
MPFVSAEPFFATTLQDLEKAFQGALVTVVTEDPGVPNVYPLAGPVQEVRYRTLSIILLYSLRQSPWEVRRLRGEADQLWFLLWYGERCHGRSSVF